MGKTLYGSARTTDEIRQAIQNSNESLLRLAARYHINPKTVAKWRKRTTVEDAPKGPQHPHSTVLTIEEEAVIAAFRRHTLLPLDDCLRALKASIPKLTRSSLHRCFKRHGISRLSDISCEKLARKKSSQNPTKHPIQHPVGYFQLDIVEVCTQEKQIYLFVGIDRTLKFGYAEFHPDRTRDKTLQFVARLAAVVPYQIHTIVSDDGIAWTNQLKVKPAFKRLFKRIK